MITGVYIQYKEKAKRTGSECGRVQNVDTESVDLTSSTFEESVSRSEAIDIASFPLVVDQSPCVMSFEFIGLKRVSSTRKRE